MAGANGAVNHGLRRASLPRFCRAWPCCRSLADTRTWHVLAEGGARAHGWVAGPPLLKPKKRMPLRASHRQAESGAEHGLKKGACVASRLRA